MLYVYFIKSQKNGDLYIGSCESVEIRLARHNAGKVKSTKGYRPWKLLETQEFLTRGEAVRKEKFYKTSEQRRLIKDKYKD